MVCPHGARQSKSTVYLDGNATIIARWHRMSIPMYSCGYLHIENGVPIIHRPSRRAEPDGLTRLEQLLEERLEPINVLDVLADTEHRLNWSRFFGPLSGHDTKLTDPIERYLDQREHLNKELRFPE